jgi:CBS domain-containing protein
MAEKRKIRDVMTKEPIVLDASATALDAARAMKARNVGDVLVRGNGQLCGIVTDRDLVVRVLAVDPQHGGDRRLQEICSGQLATLSPDANVDEAVRVMRTKAIRRIPVVENGRPVGIVSLGDLAIERDRRSALGEISAAPPTS